MTKLGVFQGQQVKKKYTFLVTIPTQIWSQTDKRIKTFSQKFLR